MLISRNFKKRKAQEYNSRLYVVMAIIFLLVGMILFKLFSLQVIKYDLYTALASSQHQVYSQLEPKRGRIFIQDNPGVENRELYPVATNKEFGLIYAVPKLVEDPKLASEKFYEIFDQAKIEKEVDELLEKDEYFKKEAIEALAGEERKVKEEFKKVKKEAEIEIRQKEAIETYYQKLTKKNDPYEPLQRKVDEEKLEKVKELNLKGIDYIMQLHRYYPEGNIGSHVLGFVGYDQDDEAGRYGLEGFFNQELRGQKGSIKTERSADGNLIIVNDREYNKPQDGSDLILTINRSIQYTVCSKLNETALRHGADAGSIIVMEPQTGAIIAMCSWPDYDPNNYNEIKDINIYNNNAIFDQYEPGSVFKVITMAAGLDQEKIQPYTLYRDYGEVKIAGWPKTIKNSDFESFGAHGIVNMTTVLELSLNTGAIFVMEEIGANIFADYIKKFGFGEKTGIELETETSGDIRNLLKDEIRPVEAATATFGQGITTTPLQMITAYAAIANSGILMKPHIVSEIISPNGSRQVTQPKQIGRIISERAALLVSGMMVKVVDVGHAKRAGVKGYYVAGKTGTAQVADKDKAGYSKDRTIHTFIGFAPADEPRFVMLVKLDDPKSVDFAESSAAPLFGELADFILNYYQVPKQR